MNVRKIKLAIGLAVGMVSVAPVIASAAADQEAAMKDSNNWAHPRGQHNNQGYSALAQVNKGNVKNLKGAWTFATGVNRGHEGSPVVVGNMMYVHTAFPNNVYALDLNDNQKIVWSYFPKQDPSVQAVLCCDNVSRGLGFGDGKIFLTQNDGTLVALDAKTGAKVWDTKIVDPKVGATLTTASHVIKDKVLVGCSGAEFGVRCFFSAYYIKDGSLAWKAYSTGPDDEMLIGEGFNKDTPEYSALSVYQDVNGGNKLGGSFAKIPNDQLKIGEKELGTRTWLKPQAVKDGWQHGGGSIWGWWPYDAKTNLVYYGIGNPSVWNPDVRPGDNKWTMSVMARDLDTGMAKWGMQMTPHDEWDYDGVNEVILFDKGGKTYAWHHDRNGFAYTWQADNGKLIAAEKVHPFVNWATDVDKKTGVPNKLASASTHQDYNTKGICPGAQGTKDQQPAAFSPKTGLMYSPMIHVCMTYEPVESKYVAGQPWVGATLTMFPGPDGVMGGFAAYNPMTNKKVWYNKEKFSAWGGALTTASNIVFYGTLDRWFKAVDANSGKELWKHQVGSGVIGNAFTYGNKGKQYVGVFSGIGGWAGVAMNLGMTNPTDALGAAGGYAELVKYNAAPGAGTLNVFSL
ncbi:MAG: PQQ-dependent dehydrogenase, methanol/ethanol family [Methylotenera sp.]|nr:PQQ-dependent dehydrogenase, methanol/ethanol family [Methylotenera sp.]